MNDLLNQQIELGQIVVWADYYSRGPRLGKVIKLTPKRVRIKAIDNTCHYQYNVLKQPNRVLVLSNSTQHYLTLAMLKNE